MKINITKKEYQTLLEMVYLSEWVLHTFTSSLEEGDIEHKALRQKIYSLYKEFQVEDLIEETSGGFNECESFHKKMYPFIERYNQNVFWESLIDQLSYRDLIRELGIEALDKLEMSEKIERLEKYRERYANEFDQHQLEYVKIEYNKQIKN